MKENSIQHDGVSVSYYIAGEGKALIFLHGFCEDHSIWEEFIKPFTETYKVILPDTPGFGKSGLPNKKITMDVYAGVMKAILDTEKIRQCVMIGHSMGGYITMNFASHYPEYLTAYGLFNSTAHEDDDVKKQDRIRTAGFVRTHGSEVFVNELYNHLFGKKYAEANADEIKRLKKYAAEVSSVEGIANASLAMGERKDTTDVLKKLKVPVLFIIGKEDKAVSPEKALTLTHLPETSVICILPDAGHMGMIEAKEECRASITELLTLVR